MNLEFVFHHSFAFNVAICILMLELGIPKTIIPTLRSIKSRSIRALLFHSAVHLLRVVFNFIICISAVVSSFSGDQVEIHPLNRFPTTDIGYKWKEIWRDFRRIWHRLALEIAQNMLSITGFYQKKVVFRIITYRYWKYRCERDIFSYRTIPSPAITCRVNAKCLDSQLFSSWTTVRGDTTSPHSGSCDPWWALVSDYRDKITATFIVSTFPLLRYSQYFRNYGLFV